jgi:hypothetical protein
MVRQATPRMPCPDCGHARTNHPNIDTAAAVAVSASTSTPVSLEQCHGVVDPRGRRSRCDCTLTRVEIELLFRSHLSVRYDRDSAIVERLRQCRRSSPAAQLPFRVGPKVKAEMDAKMNAKTGPESSSKSTPNRSLNRSRNQSRNQSRNR